MQKLIILLLLATSSLFAQTGKVLEAYNSLASNDLKNAKILIDEAAKEPSNLKDYHFWYWKGFIYKDLYKEQDKGVNHQSVFRDEAVAAFTKVLDYKEKLPEDTLTSVLKLLSYFSSTYFNSAVISLDTTKYEIAIENYEKFQSTSKLVDPTVDLRDRDIKFKMKLATVYVALYEVRANQSTGDIFFDKAKEEYSEIIRMDHDNLTANYNLGIQFYNKAVNIIKNLDVGTSLEDLAEKEDICVDLFLQALPYVKTAYELDPTRKETLIGLTGIYWSLNDIEKFQFYQDKLKQIE
ncbi:MAG TPA: hypothetical protein DCX54_08505 [Flavobacteriales bacterium]|nr:hypothetical protein [Flavobacteriales bacterium]